MKNPFKSVARGIQRGARAVTRAPSALDRVSSALAPGALARKSARAGRSVGGYAVRGTVSSARLAGRVAMAPAVLAYSAGTGAARSVGVGAVKGGSRLAVDTVKTPFQAVTGAFKGTFGGGKKKAAVVAASRRQQARTAAAEAYASPSADEEGAEDDAATGGGYGGYDDSNGGDDGAAPMYATDDGADDGAVAFMSEPSADDLEEGDAGADDLGDYAEQLAGWKSTIKTGIKKTAKGAARGAGAAALALVNDRFGGRGAVAPSATSTWTPGRMAVVGAAVAVPLLYLATRGSNRARA